VILTPTPLRVWADDILIKFNVGIYSLGQNTVEQEKVRLGT
jgi:hypothetical protein